MTGNVLTKKSIENIKSKIEILDCLIKVSSLHKEQIIAIRTGIKVLKEIIQPQGVSYRPSCQESRIGKGKK